MEPKEIPSCLIPCLLVVFNQQLEILVTAPIYLSIMIPSFDDHLIDSTGSEFLLLL